MTKKLLSKTPFKEAVERIVRNIPKGETLSYGEVALRVGNRNGARAVGMIMARNKDKSVPCHRVVRKDGLFGDYNGLINGTKGPKAKQALLDLERDTGE